MPLDPQAAALMEQMARLAPERLNLHEHSAQQARAIYSATMPPTTDDPVGSVEDRTIPGPGGPLPVRIYRPQGEGVLPVVVYFHGGGWLMGDLDTHDALCRSVTSRSGCVLVAVHYRLAPEHPFPAALDDAVAAVEWVAANSAELGVDAGRLAVDGDSSGGNLAAAACLVARDKGGPPIAFQLLVYPVLAHSFDQPSYTENAEGYILTPEAMRWFSGHYLSRPEDATNPLAAPLLAADLSGLPPAHVMTTEYDPLRDEGEEYASRLAEAGVPVTVHRVAGMIHGYLRMGAVIDEAHAGVDECARVLREALRPEEAGSLKDAVSSAASGATDAD